MEDFRTKSTQLSTDLGEHTMTFMQQLLEKGRKEGVLEGLLEGRLEGEAFGLQRGEQIGRLEGRLEGKRAMLRTLIQRKFMMLPTYAEQCIQNADGDKLDRWIENIFDARSIDDLLR